MNTKQSNQSLTWKISVPIFQNVLILRQLGLAIGIPFGVLIVALTLLAEDRERLYALGLIALLLVLTVLFVLGVYGGKYDAAFTLNAKGIRCATQPGQAKKNKLINGLTVVLGLISGKPAVAGAGMMAAARQSVWLPWQRIRSVRYLPKHHTIVLRASPLESVGVFCTADNYAEVQAIIQSRTKHS